MSQLSLSETLPILSQPVRDCGMTHENVGRCTPSGRPKEFLNQCPLRAQHAGCPHFLERAFVQYGIASDAHVVLASRNQPLAEAVQRNLQKLRKIDDAIRIARTNARDEDDLQKMRRVPAMTKARQEVVDNLLKEQRVILAEMEGLRKEILACLSAI